MAFRVSIQHFPLKLLTLVTHMNHPPHPEILVKHRTPLRTPALETTHLGYVRRAADRKRMGLTEDLRETWVRVRRRKLDGFPAPQISAVRLYSSLSGQTHPCSKYKARPKRSHLEIVHISDAYNKKRRSLRPPGSWKVQEVQNYLKDGAQDVCIECRHSVIKIKPFIQQDMSVFKCI